MASNRANIDRALGLWALDGDLSYCPHDPTANQHVALWLAEQTREVFYGGAAGGGKSDWMLMGALAYVHIPEYSALIMRRTFRELNKRGSLIPRSHEWLSGTDAHWSGEHSRWSFPSGATLEFGHCEHEKDRFAYQSAEYQCVAFDELTSFSETIYRYIGFSRVRRLRGSAVPTRTLGASNPGNHGHAWVDDRFHCDAAKWKDIPQTPGRAFVPARMADNPYLDVEEYAESLQHLRAVERVQLMEGDWSARELGDFMSSEWFPVVDAVPAGGREARYWDFASTKPHKGNPDPDWTRGCRGKIAPDGIFYITDFRSARDAPGAVQALVKSTAGRDTGRVQVHWEEEGGSAGKIASHHLRQLLMGYSAKADRVTGSKISRAVPLANQAEAGNVRVLRGGWNQDWWDEVDAFGSGAGHDDMIDAASGLFGQLSGSWGWSDLYPNAGQGERQQEARA